MKTLRTRMVLAVCVSAIFVFALSFLLINISLQTTTQSRLDGITDLIAKNDGEFPARAQYETLENGDFYVEFLPKAANI